MKIYKDIIQGTTEWHEIRYGKIGGTLAKGLFVESDTLLNNLISCNLEPFELEEDGYISDEMQRGMDLEPMARAEMEKYTGIKFLESGWLESVEIPLIGISPDGLSECSEFACEIKCPSKEKHTKTLLSGEIPSDNLHQCIHYFTVNKSLKSLYFGSFRPESKHPLFVKELKLSDYVNLGTKAKPVMKTVAQAAFIARTAAECIQVNIKASIDKLDF